MTHARQGEQPDIVLIHGHDFGDWLSCYGRPSVPTPRIQRFADQGIVFDNAFATSPLCTPARSSIFTGMLPHQNGLLGLSHAGWRYGEGVVTLPEHLGSLGYRTALLGLQHEDLDARALGYDEVHGLGFLPRGLEVARLTERWVSGVAQVEERPIFAAIGLWEAHRPWPAEDYDHVDPATVDVPPYLPDNEHTRADLAGFYGALAQMDEAFARIVEAFDSSGRTRPLVVVLTTDHGIAFPRAKSTLYDSGVKVSFVVRPPAGWGLTPGRREELVSHLDIVPTFIDLAGGEQPEGLSGQSIVDLLQSPSDHPDDRALFLEKTYHDRFDPIRAVRTRTAKLIRNYADAPRLPLPLDLELSETRAGMGDAHLAPRPREELYDLVADPDEGRNVVDEPHYATVRQDLGTMLDVYLRESEDPVVFGEMPQPEAPRARGVRVR
jgi:arylsulfatase A-like enzyme